MGAGASATFPLWAWLVFAGVVLVLIFLDFFVFHREAREVPFKEALWLSAFWIAVSRWVSLREAQEGYIGTK